MGCTPARPLPPPGSPNIIVYTVDTLRADRLGFAGHPAARTPHFDALARRGRVFAEATTPLTRTTPALASLLSGLDPRGHASWEVGAPVPSAVPLLPELLHEAGWATIAASGSRVASPKQGLGRGFQTFLVQDDPRATDLVQAALAAVATVDADRPVFLWVHTTDPHFPYRVPEGHPAAGQTPLCDALGRRFTKRPKHRWRIFSNHDGKAAEALTECQVAYDAEVQAADSAFGALMEGLGPRADGLVVLTADHGENQGEGALWYEHGPDAHDATLRVPLVVAGPGLSPATDHHPARLQDIAPTLLALAGVPFPEAPFSGTDLLGDARPTAAVGVSASALHVGLTRYLHAGRVNKRHCLHAPATDHSALSLCSDGLFDRKVDPTLATVAVPGTDPSVLEAAAELWPPEQTRQWVARTADWKLIADPVLEGGFSYRLVRPGAESGADQSPAHPEVRRTLEAILHKESRPASVVSPSHAAPGSGGLSPEEDQELRALGYIE